MIGISRISYQVVGGEVVQVVIADGVVGLGGVNEGQPRSPEKARILHLEDITNSLLEVKA